MRALLLLSLLVAQPASAQDGTDDVAMRRQLLELRRELDDIHTDGPDAAAEIGTQLVFAGSVLTLVGSLCEVISQEISGRWRFAEPPWFLLTGAIAGVVLGAIGTPLLVWGITDGRHRRRRELQQEIERLQVELAVRPAPDGVLVSLAGTF